MTKTLRNFAVGAAILLCFGLMWHSARASFYTRSEASTSAAEPFDAASLYDKKCAECHGKDGRSHTFRGKHTHSRDLADAQWQDQVTDERIYNSIANGKNKMPAFSKKLSDADINSLVTYVRSLKK
jgi:mono/diheme cytochrome c family protein